MRLIIASNRLPFTLVKKDNTLQFRNSIGGLTSGISSYIQSNENIKKNYLWCGWPGAQVEESDKRKIILKAKNNYHSIPVFLSSKVVDKFYSGFCNKTVWPLFHYFPSYCIYNKDYWNSYIEVNKTFATTLASVVKAGDIIFIQDYHLMLLPKMLRRLLKDKIQDISLAFFLHIPFPSYEIFRLLPAQWRADILQGMLGADVIGFHTYDYSQYFLRGVSRILGIEQTLGKISVNDHITKVGAFPLGIDPSIFQQAAKSPMNKKHQTLLEESIKDKKVILSVDRLDYTKGIGNRLKGYELFLKNNPQWHKKIILSLVVVPSRTEVDQYQIMKRQIDELIGRINGRYGTMDWTPIMYQFRSLSISQLVALYTVSDIALITPFRDGMNLIAKEYLASRIDRTGVLILSEMAGAVKELSEALIINPNDTGEIADAIQTALSMPESEQIRRNTHMQRRLERYTSTRWAEEILASLQGIKEEQKIIKSTYLTTNDSMIIRDDYLQTNKRLIFLDYDGTLVPFVKDPQTAKPTREVLKILSSLAKNPKNEVVLISGRGKETLEKWFGKLPLNLVAEHGAWVKEKGDAWKLIKPLSNTWKGNILPLLERYVDILPGSFIEEKDFSLAWHYRKCDSEIASVKAKELGDDLMEYTANSELQIMSGSKVIEVKNSSINKGTAALYWLYKSTPKFVMAIGDDWTDEDLFEVLPKGGYSIKVGASSSAAKYRLKNPQSVISFLKQIVASPEEGQVENPYISQPFYLKTR